MFKESLIENIFHKVKQSNPLNTFLTNYVTANDCANIALALGGSPIVIDSNLEILEAINNSKSLLLNIGTINTSSYNLMLNAGRAALEKDIPVILDPVGAGFTKFRSQVSKTIACDCKPTVIKGNSAEINFLANDINHSDGLDSNLKTTNNYLADLALKTAVKYDCVTIITGKKDYISDGSNTVILENGCKELSQITGTGCILGAIISVLASCNADIFKVAIISTALMSIAGEIAIKINNPGLAGFKNNLLDEIGNFAIPNFNKYLKIKYV